MPTSQQPLLRFWFQRPELPPPEAWQPLLRGAYETHRFSNHGPLALQLEAHLSARVGRRVVLAANGTAAITAALLALERTGGVILPSFTFPATLGAVLQAGLTPVLADVNPQTWELDVATIQAAAEAYGGPLAAVLGVRTFGMCRDWAPVQTWCDAHGLPLVLDSAAALGGALPGGVPVGRQGRMETFSLHATKVFAVGEGGAIACDAQDVSLLRRVMNFGLHDGALQGWGFNGKVSEFTAAIGLAQDAAFDAHLAARRSAATAYAELYRAEAPAWGLASAPGVPPWQAYPVLAPTADLADRFEAAAARFGVQTRRYYRPALHTVAGAGGDSSGQPLPVSADLAARMVCLPMYSRWEGGEREALFEALRAALSACSG
ncbi:DegT/DnrJ/EryC1/StrS aminotransferase family protein [Thiomonas sp. FB-Cd]|uniref:DegT/DnrJ/EryC1/StrS family aminotransferase n=1 Tax=Thiomonas sp. FB-Cd TaxID=1158292 RepID=UPI0018CC74B6|nr:DegT/DnrJ/EryC1/StrS family aminotransferase [Thiomonas sp. FB-Cd]